MSKKNTSGAAEADVADVIASSLKRHDEAWQKRLEVFRDVFPWVTESIKEMAGLPANDPLDTTESRLTFLRAHNEYRKGSNSDDERVRSLHLRQNRAWEELTGHSPLNSPGDWRAAGMDAGATQSVLDEVDVLAIQARNVSRLARYIIPWAKQLRARSGRREADPQPAGIPPDKRTKPLTKKQAAKLLGRHGDENRAVEWLNACIEDGIIRWEKRSRQSGIYHRDDFPAEVQDRIRP